MGRGEIIGGWEAGCHSRPYVAFLNIETGGDGKGCCGGLLIWEDVLVTAAYCNCNPGNIFVYLRVQDFMKPGQNWQQIQAHHWVQHPGFNDEDFHNDIMLLSLSRPWQLSHSAELTEWVVPIPLPETNHHVSPGPECSMARWGQTEVNTTTDRLQEPEQEVVLRGLCKEQYRHYDPTTMLCAGSPDVKKSPFQDDYGGPLVCDGVAQGISSWNFHAMSPPEVYTSVSHFVPWIEKVMKKLSHSRRASQLLYNFCYFSGTLGSIPHWPAPHAVVGSRIKMI
ncbi:mast cell protease 1A-like [Malaclemys terrapin pileata]|uniref:mast cell protease 1A-like n=1 Tax=Malaclemys terrapin pileata TaxID=2991368 RepID=UPI0023A89004|nr:mast cell protease 1A-like [Malaclemys terrapin pileata]